MSAGHPRATAPVSSRWLPALACTRSGSGMYKVRLWCVQGQGSQHSSVAEGEAQGTLLLAEELWEGDGCWEERGCFLRQDACVAVMALYLHTRMTLDSGL